jgi:hypothetical protein
MNSLTLDVPVLAAASRSKEPKAPKPSPEMPEPAADTHAQSVVRGLGVKEVAVQDVSLD